MFGNIREQFITELGDMRAGGMYKDEGVLEDAQGAEIVVGGKTLLNFCANNYLGLASDPRLADAAVDGIRTYGFGMASVRFICGTSRVHKDLERAVSEFFGAEDAILYGSCFDANTGLFETLLAEGDAIFSDELNHASIIDGVRLCKAERFRYRHGDMQDLEEKLKAAGRRRRSMIATDGVFSMDGDTARIGEMCDLAERYGALVMVDDSHGSGVLGRTGRGSIEGMMDRVDILTSTFGKALGGAAGGFTAGRREIVEYLRQRSRTTLFSNSMPPAIASSALWVLRNFDEALAPLRERLADNTRYFRTAMEKQGFTLGGDGSHPITPVMLGEEKRASDLAAAVTTRGVWVRGFTYPVVPRGKARIRVQISAAHTREQMDRAIAAFRDAARELNILAA